MNRDLGTNHYPGTARLLTVLSTRVRKLRLVLLLCAALPIAGCGLAAAPCRVGSAGLKIVPVVGHAAAAPTDACADVIDP